MVGANYYDDYDLLDPYRYSNLSEGATYAAVKEAVERFADKVGSTPEAVLDEAVLKGKLLQVPIREEYSTNLESDLYMRFCMMTIGCSLSYDAVRSEYIFKPTCFGCHLHAEIRERDGTRKLSFRTHRQGNGAGVEESSFNLAELLGLAQEAHNGPLPEDATIYTRVAATAAMEADIRRQRGDCALFGIPDCSDDFLLQKQYHISAGKAIGMGYGTAFSVFFANSQRKPLDLEAPIGVGSDEEYVPFHSTIDADWAYSDPAARSLISHVANGGDVDGIPPYNGRSRFWTSDVTEFPDLGAPFGMRYLMRRDGRYMVFGEDETNSIRNNASYLASATHVQAIAAQDLSDEALARGGFANEAEFYQAVPKYEVANMDSRAFRYFQEMGESFAYGEDIFRMTSDDFDTFLGYYNSQCAACHGSASKTTDHWGNALVSLAWPTALVTNPNFPPAQFARGAMERIASVWGGPEFLPLALCVNSGMSCNDFKMNANIAGEAVRSGPFGKQNHIVGGGFPGLNAMLAAGGGDTQDIQAIFSPVNDGTGNNLLFVSNDISPAAIRNTIAFYGKRPTISKGRPGAHPTFTPPTAAQKQAVEEGFAKFGADRVVVVTSVDPDTQEPVEKVLQLVRERMPDNWPNN